MCHKNYSQLPELKSSFAQRCKIDLYIGLVPGEYYGRSIAHGEQSGFKTSLIRLARNTCMIVTSTNNPNIRFASWVSAEDGLAPPTGIKILHLWDAAGFSS
jgi:hypothetical protein